jgi:hypothetical protein
MKPLKQEPGALPEPPAAEPPTIRFMPDADASLEEITNALASLRAAADQDLVRRARLVDDLDALGRARAEPLALTIAAVYPKTTEERRVWSSLCSFWREDAQAITGLLKEYFVGAKGASRLTRTLPTLIVRATRSYAMLVKLLSVRYAPLDDTLWKELGFVYALAERRNVLGTRVALEERKESTTARDEFLKLVMFASGAPENLTPMRLQLAEEVIGAFKAGFDVTTDPRPGATYWIDLASARGPQRYIKSVASAPTIRFFAAVRALEEVDLAIGSILVNNSVPSELSRLTTTDLSEVLAVLRHVRAHWSPRLPARRHKRVPVRSDIMVAWGLDSILDLLDSPPRQFLIDMSTGAPLATWRTEDVSRGGLSAQAPQTNDEWLAIGVLVAVKVPQDDTWQVGVVQRLRRTPNSDFLVGIEVLSRKPRAVTAVPDRLGPGAAESVIVMNDVSNGREAVVLMRPGRHVPTTGFIVQLGNKSYRLDPEQVARSGADYELVTCRATLRHINWERVD